ncbi:hypothetical protein TRFO_17918 [Tritrichomonas foetus]|uniref:Peptidase M60 domain-containing protein n=1 Tax=Tritrichomonas foetus TaxID=1144522 RepID=A0A1J4KM03_9EUKA|nr:hypothetical protein TRFO_17918 [Tritrichomonas foetus]|eukprot:OHT12329.1 hypothetical protein TRFO_17918 [Tritrichomonas foetus]
MFFLQFIVYVSASYSRHGAPGSDKVVHFAPDGFIVLSEVAKPPKAPYIKNANLTKIEIPDGAYPYPGHSYGQGYKNVIYEEAREIRKKYENKKNITQEDLYYHPSAYDQYLITEEVIDNAKRYQVRFMFNNPYSYDHKTAYFLAPGELVTVKLHSQDAVGVIRLRLNYQSDDCDINSGYNRYPILNTFVDLTQETVIFGTPFGGQISFEYMNGFSPDTAKYPVEITLSGVILGPQFIYGITTDEEFEKQLIELPGPFVTFDTGNIIGQGPKTTTKNHIPIRMNDCMFWLRSACELSHQVANDSYGNPQVGRIYKPNGWKFDENTRGGWAVALVGVNYCIFPLDLLPGLTDYGGLLKGSWGIMHELNHHHQTNWGNFGERPDVGGFYPGETTNNLINLIIFAAMSEPEIRIDNGNGSVSRGSNSGNDVESPYFTLKNPELLGFWATLMHSFGIDKLKQVIYDDQHDVDFDKKIYGNDGAALLRFGKIFGFDCSGHFEFYQIGVKNQAALDAIKKLNLTPFHPVANFYTSGFVVNGEEFTTCYPFDIPYGQPYVFPFKNLTGTHEGQGNFTLVEFECPTDRQSAWKLIDEGNFIYQYTPLNDTNFIDKFYLTYYDSTTNLNTTLVGTIRQRYFQGTRVTFSMKDTYNDIVKAYEAALKLTPTSVLGKNDARIPQDTSNTKNELYIYYYAIHLPAGIYSFSLQMQDHGLFYISNTPFDPTKKPETEPLLKGDHFVSNYGYINSEEKEYEEGKYYILLVAYNNGVCYCAPGYKTKGSNQYLDITTKMTVYVTEPPADYDPEPIPYFTEMMGTDYWELDRDFSIDTSKFVILEHPKGQDPISTGYTPYRMFDGRTDLPFFPVWWPGVGKPRVEFPHIYVIDMMTQQQFDVIKYESNGGYLGSHYKMHSHLEIRLSDSRDGLSNNDSIIFSGIYDTDKPEIELEKMVKGQFLKLIIKDNSIDTWDGMKSGSNIVELSFFTKANQNKVLNTTNTITPATHSQIKYSNGVNKTRDGAYYNGYGYIAPSGESIEFTFEIGVDQIIVLGDKWPEMGEATVTIDDGIPADIDRTIYSHDGQSLKFASRSARSPIYISDKLDNTTAHTMKICCTKGKIIFTGFVTNKVTPSPPDISITESPSDISITPSPSDISITPSPLDISITESFDSAKPSSLDSAEPSSLEWSDNPSDNDDGDQSGNSSLTIGQISGIAIGIVAVIAIIVTVVIFMVKKMNSDVGSSLEIEIETNSLFETEIETNSLFETDNNSF